MKFLFWQFGLYALAAFAVGFGAAWSWFHERTNALENALERARTRVGDIQEFKLQLQSSRTAEREATEAVAMLKTRLQESELGRTSAELDVETLRANRLKLLGELSELRAHLDASVVSATRLVASEQETLRLRMELNGTVEQLRTERSAREQTMDVLQSRLVTAEAALAQSRIALQRFEGQTSADVVVDLRRQIGVVDLRPGGGDSGEHATADDGLVGSGALLSPAAPASPLSLVRPVDSGADV